MFSRRTEWGLAPNRFSLALEQTRGNEILDLTVSNPTRAGLIYDQSAILGALSNPKSLDYDPQAKGLLEARSAVATYYADRGDHVSAESLVLTTGTSEAYSFVFRLLANPGDEILVATPSYPLFDFLADLQDVNLRPFPLLYDYGWQIDFHALRQALSDRTRAIVLVHPNNPTGSFVSPGERERLNEMCADRGIAIIVDEVFLDYPHDGRQRQSFVSNCEALTFTLSGISKISGLPQMKLGWIAASGPEQHLRPAMQRLEIIADTFLSVSAPIQWVAAQLLQQRKNIQAQLATRIRENVAELDRQLQGQQLCSRLDMAGGWYAILRVPATQSDEQLAVDLLHQAGVAIHPGHFYDFPAEGYLVLSLITEKRVFQAGTERLLNFVKSAHSN
jgi:aspartate/methionine/tyrosine aminotransferase